MFFANARSRRRFSKRPSRARKPAAKRSGKGVRTATSKTGKKWFKTPGGDWVQGGSRAAAAPRGARSRKGKRSGDRPWPKKGSRKMGRAVAGVEARVHEDLIKAHKLLQSARFRIRHTAKASGGRAGGAEKTFAGIVKALDGLLTRL